MTTATKTPCLEIACELISRKSVTPEDDGCQRYIAQRLAKLGFKCEHMRFDDVDNLWARIGDDAPLFVFAGHTDVVPPGPIEDWTHPPFTPTLADGKLYGRGACDMKSAIAAMLAAVQSYLADNALKGSIAFLITSDEEGPAINGTRKVVKKLTERGDKIDYCIMGEASSEKQTGDQIRIGRRGSLHGHLTIHGKQGHVAFPEDASNPIHACAKALHELSHETWDEGNNDFPPTTFQISNIHAGTGAKNVIPGHVEIEFNLRFSTALTPDDIKQRTEAILTEYNLDYDIRWDLSAEPFLTKKGKLLSAAQNAIKQVSGLDPVLSTGGGTSDGRFIAPTGAELIELGVPHATAHQVDENVSLRELEKLTETYFVILKQLFC